MHILSLLPKQLQIRATVLTDLGIENLAWSGQDALDVITNLKKEDWAILGGDVLQWKDDGQHIELTYDNWYLDKIPEWSWHEYVVRSYEHTRRYILAYLEANKEKGIAFSFVVASLEQFDGLKQGSH